ncbi:MAG: RNA-guided endonuclease InsQ/TnpB family protein [Acidimicrobiales bacterium]
MQLRYNFRLYPAPCQRQSLARAFGCARVVFNDGLRLREEAHKEGLAYPTDGVVSRSVITDAKKTPERAWLSEVSAVVLQQAVADLNSAYRAFFDSGSGKRKGPKVGHPKFRSKRDHRQSIRFTKNSHFRITDGRKLRLAKIGDVKVRWSRELPSQPSSVTVIKDSSGRYFASFVVEMAEVSLPEATSEVGIDLGLTTFAVLSDGTKIASPRFLARAERKLRRAQRSLSRKEKGSNNREAARIKVARAHAKVGDARRDFHHKASTAIIRENQAVYVEDLCVKGLARTKLAKSVHDAGWSTFVSMLEYKAKLYGRELCRIGRFVPTSQTCSACGVVDGPKPLSVRTWACGPCGAIHDRDHNAALNILAAGRAERLNACGGDVRPGVIQAVPSEAGTLRRDAA